MAWSFAAWNLSGGLPGQGVFRISIKKKKISNTVCPSAQMLWKFFPVPMECKHHTHTNCQVSQQGGIDRGVLKGTFQSHGKEMKKFSDSEIFLIF